MYQVVTESLPTGVEPRFPTVPEEKLTWCYPNSVFIRRSCSLLNLDSSPIDCDLVPLSKHRTGMSLDTTISPMTSKPCEDYPLYNNTHADPVNYMSPSLPPSLSLNKVVPGISDPLSSSVSTDSTIQSPELLLSSPSRIQLPDPSLSPPPSPSLPPTGSPVSPYSDSTFQYNEFNDKIIQRGDSLKIALRPYFDFPNHFRRTRFRTTSIRSPKKIDSKQLSDEAKPENFEQRSLSLESRHPNPSYNRWSSYTAWRSWGIWRQNRTQESTNFHTLEDEEDEEEEEEDREKSDFYSYEFNPLGHERLTQRPRMSHPKGVTELQIISNNSGISATLFNSNDLFNFLLLHPHYHRSYDLLRNQRQKTQRSIVSRQFSNSIAIRARFNNLTRTNVTPVLVSKAIEPSLYSIASAIRPPPIIFIPGGGIFFFWKAGFVSYLAAHFDLSKLIFIGTSAGALASALVCSGSNIAKAARLAIKLGLKNGVWERPYFLAGILHNIARCWLEEVIPTDPSIIDSLRSRLILTAYRVSRVRLEAFCSFTSREDLIECLLASIHIPFYANGKFSVKARAANYLDGSFGANLMKAFAENIPEDSIIIIRCNENDYGKSVPRRECLKKLPPSQLFELLRNGYSFASQLHSTEKLQPLKDYQLHPPGTFKMDDNPYFSFERLFDNTLD